MIRHLIVCSTLFLFLFSCNNGNAPLAGAAFDSTGFQLEDIPGTGYQHALKMGENSYIQEEGNLLNGQKEGTWITYHPATPFPATIANYTAGAYNGTYLEFTEHGQMSLRATYQNNKLHGFWGKYSFGRPEMEAFYKDGQLNGPYYEYDTHDGKLQKEINYKNGKQDGKYRFYNEEGKVTVEYDYRDGEKVGGGIVGEGQ